MHANNTQPLQLPKHQHRPGISGYDIIGDVHGMADKLHQLLQRLGYQLGTEGWFHPGRQVIFIGDLIDNGMQTRETLTTVRQMVDHENALVVMGNHELNAVAWEMRHSDTGLPLREHSDTNLAHHLAFLQSIPQRSERLEWLAWFKTLPVYLDFGDLRCVHACWHPASLQVMQPYLTATAQLQETAWQPAFATDHPLFHAVENVLKGIEISLPEGLSFFDHKGKRRYSSRISWWLEDAASLADMVHIPMPSRNREVLARLAQLPAHAELLQQSIYHGDCPVFFGHYWLKPEPRILSPKTACTDYSAGKDGPLVAYRWNGEQALNDHNWVTSYD